MPKRTNSMGLPCTEQPITARSDQGMVVAEGDGVTEAVGEGIGVGAGLRV
ncbi:MAG: hypothetical protein IPH82_19740 [Chloroflexi bacterium]|nr:hypothetical protein [Chloroflexota bacterium]